MSKSVSLLLVVGLVSVVSACAKKEEPVVYADPEPISVEPTYTGKYK